jgi:5-hydroxyisourate hydrolase-like protein (transthyretin family)
MLQYKYHKWLILTLLISFCFMTITAQNEDQITKPVKTKIKVSYWKKFDNTRVLTATISARINKKPVTVKNVPVNFYIVSDTMLELLGTVSTNEDGQAIYSLPADFSLSGDSILSSTFKIEFEGNDKFKPKSKEITVRDMELNISFEVIDSVNTLIVNANEETVNGGEIPVNETDVYVYVERLFSLLKIGEGWMEDGQAKIEFPDDIPGDKEGILNIVVRIEDSDLYGNVEQKAISDWGVPHRDNPALSEKRALWTPNAPLWMIITLNILVIGVLYHYILIIYKLFVIRKEGKNIS